MAAILNLGAKVMSIVKMNAIDEFPTPKLVRITLLFANIVLKKIISFSPKENETGQLMFANNDHQGSHITFLLTKM